MALACRAQQLQHVRGSIRSSSSWSTGAVVAPCGLSSSSSSSRTAGRRSVVLVRAEQQQTGEQKTEAVSLWGAIGDADHA